MSLNQGKKRKPKNKKQPQPVAAKRFKPNNPKQAAPKKTVQLENQSKLFLEVLLGDLPKDEFLQSYWQKSPFFTQGALPKLAALLDSSLDVPSLQPLFDKQHLYLRNDISVIKYQPADDQVCEMTERGRVQWSHIQDFLKDGWAVVMPHLFSFHPPFASLLTLFEKSFDASNRLEFNLTIASPGTVPSPPTAFNHDIFIIQLEGSQEVHVYTTPGTPARPPVVVMEEDEKDEAEKETKPPTIIPEIESKSFTQTFNSEPLKFSSEELASKPDLHFDSITLEKGDCLYIPSGQSFVILRSSGVPQEDEEDDPYQDQGTSMDLMVSIPCLPDWKEMVDAVIKESKVAMNTELQRPMPTIFGSSDPTKHFELCNEALKKSIEIQQRVFDNLLFQKSFSKMDFIFPISKYKLRNKILESGGLIKIDNFLPMPVAERIESVLKGIQESEWLPTEAQRNYSQNNIAHSFVSSKEFAYSKQVFSIFKQLLPKQEITISAARYTAGHFIEPHDDDAFKVIDEKLYERDIAFVYYLSRDWKEENGGAFVDLFGGGNVKIYPKFNSLVSFIVPRQHSVEKVVGESQRLSIFGWFMKEAPVKAGEGGGDEEKEIVLDQE